MNKPQTIAIVGAGLVGSGWAIVFARAGYKVRIYDPNPDIRNQFLKWAEKSLITLQKAGLIEQADSVISQLSIHEQIMDALKDVDYIQESVYETLEAKTKACQMIDTSMGKNAIVGSSSSGIPASHFTETCKHRDRFLIAHPVNPPHLVPVVELVPSPWTDKSVLLKTRELMKEVGQVPITLTKEIDGFVLNRLQGALLNEAWALYEEGIAELADIDATISHGLGLRWLFMGPFETIDLNAPEGIADYASRLAEMYHGMAKNRTPSLWMESTIKRADSERRKILPKSDLANRRAWRDETLAKLAAFKKSNNL